MKNDGLLAYRKNVTSEYGEDGIIERIFNIVGERSRWCVELGALNGKHHSNVWNLLKNREWSGVLIEADPTYYERLAAEYASTPSAHTIQAFVSFEGEQALDAIFSKTPLPREFDLLSLDIDGNDYHLWDSLKIYLPRVLVIEFNPSIPSYVSFVQRRDMSVYQGSSLKSIVELSRTKGYELIAVNEGNAFFVKKELFPLFSIEDNSIEALHTDRKYETYVFQLYDGTFVYGGNISLIWHKIPVDVHRMQPLPRHKRKYPARISPDENIRSLKYLIRKQPWYTFVQNMRKALVRR